MPTLTTTRNYAALAVLTEAQLDAAFDSIETLLNTTKLDDDNIQDGGITGVKLDSAVVDNSTIAISSNQLIVKSGGIGRTQLGSPGRSISSNVTINVSSTSAVDITGLTVTITTLGGPVFVGLMSGHTTATGSSPAQGSIVCNNASATTSQASMLLYRDSTLLAHSKLSTGHAGSTSALYAVPPGTVAFIDTPTAGTYVYKMQSYVSSGTNLSGTDIKMFAYELW